MVSIARTALATAILLASGEIWAQLPTELYPRQVTQGEAVQLTIELGDAPGGADDLSPLEEDFKVLGRSQQSSTVIRNGKMTRSKKLILNLAPKRSGQLEVPAFTLEGDQTEPQRLLVKEVSAEDQAELAEQVRISGTLSERSVYVQQPLLYTLRVELAEQLFDGTIVGPEVEEGDALIEEYGEQKQYRAQRGSQLIQVVEQQYLITPQRSGVLRLSESELGGKIPQGRARNTVFGPQYNRFRQVSLRTESHQLEVKPIPSGWQASSWLPASDVTLSDDWQMDSLEVGQPITRTLTLVARGVGASQLPDLQIKVPAGVRQYPEEPVVDQSVEDGVLVSTLRQQVTLIPTAPGAIEFPAVEQPWWNTARNRAEAARIESTGLQISGEVAQQTVPAQPAPSAQSSAPVASVSPQNAAAVLPAGAAEQPAVTSDQQIEGAVVLSPGLMAGGAMALLLALGGGFWLGRRGKPAEESVQPEAKPIAPVADTGAIRKACQQHDARAVRLALQAWCQQRWPDGGNLNRLASEAGEPLRSELQAMNRSLYSEQSDGQWRGDNLWTVFEDFSSLSASQSKAKAELSALNPQ